MKKIRLTSLLVASAIALAASSSAFASNNEVFAGIGSDGLGIGYAYGINQNFSVHAEYDGLSYSGTYNNSDTNYHGNLHLQSSGVYGDYFPMGGSFRVTAGYIDSGSKFSGEADGDAGTVTINHVRYSLAGESAKVSIAFPSSMPYLGIGWGHNATKPGFGFYGDLGVQFGNPKTNIALSPGLAAMVPASDVSEQERQINSDVKVLGGWPVLSFGVAYRF